MRGEPEMVKSMLTLIMDSHLDPTQVKSVVKLTAKYSTLYSLVQWSQQKTKICPMSDITNQWNHPSTFGGKLRELLREVPTEAAPVFSNHLYERGSHRQIDRETQSYVSNESYNGNKGSISPTLASERISLCIDFLPSFLNVAPAHIALL